MIWNCPLCRWWGIEPTWSRLNLTWLNVPVWTTISEAGIGKLPCVYRLYIRPRQGVPHRGGYPCHRPKTDVTNDEELEAENYDLIIDEIYEGYLRVNMDLNEHLFSAAHDNKHGGVDVSHIYKIWRINIEAAKWSLGVTTQHIQCTENTKIPRKYGINNRILW